MFTYHHNNLEAYLPIAVAMLDAGLVCSASLPCPAEMGGSIHISGTGSSIIDTVFVCRTHGTVSRRVIVSDVPGVAGLRRPFVRIAHPTAQKGGGYRLRGTARVGLQWTMKPE